jgi:hypothetical protein
MSVAQAGALAAHEMGRWSCYADNLSDRPLKLSVAGFALDFIELHQVQPSDVIDIFNQKQKMTKAAKAARAFEFIGVVGLLVSGQTFLKLSPATAAKLAQSAGLGTYGATKLGAYFTQQVPSTTVAISDMLTADVVLQPGESKSWKTYASKIHDVHALGPRILTQPAAVK